MVAKIKFSSTFRNDCNLSRNLSLFEITALQCSTPTLSCWRGAILCNAVISCWRGAILHNAVISCWRGAILCNAVISCWRGAILHNAVISCWRGAILRNAVISCWRGAILRNAVISCWRGAILRNAVISCWRGAILRSTNKMLKESVDETRPGVMHDLNYSRKGTFILNILMQTFWSLCKLCILRGEMLATGFFNKSFANILL